MKNQFVQTKNAKRLLAGLAQVGRRGAREACLVVVDGEPGLGKTDATQWWAVQHSAVYLRMKSKMTAPWLLRELLTEMRVTPQYSFERMYSQSLEALGRAAAAAENNSQPFGVVIDEADHIVSSRQILETIRDLSDMLEIPFVLVGMGRIRGSLTRFPQIASRVGAYVEFVPADAADVTELARSLCDVEIADDLIAYLAQVSRGRARDIKEGLASIERFGRRNPGVVDLARMAGQTLMYDRATSRPVVVRP